MFVRLPRAFILTTSVFVITLAAPTLTPADPASDLATAEEAEVAAQANVVTAENRVKGAEKNLDPIATKADAAKRSHLRKERHRLARREMKPKTLFRMRNPK